LCKKERRKYKNMTNIVQIATFLAVITALVPASCGGGSPAVTDGGTNGGDIDTVTDTDAAAFCTQIDDVAVTGFVDLQRLGVAITVVNDDIVAVVGSDWSGFHYERALELFDVQDPSAPQLIGSHYAPGKASAVEVADGYAYLADAELGLIVFDIGDPTTPVRIGHYEQPGVFDVKLDGEYAYISFTAAFEETDSSGFLILDIGDRTTPGIVGSFDTIGGVYGLAVQDGHVFVTNMSVLRVVDVRDVTNPIEVASYDTGDVAFNAEVVNGYAYIANFASGIHVVDISDLEAPRFVASVATDFVNFDVTIAGTFAYVPDDMSGLKLLDFEDPENPFEVGTYRPPYWARDVAVIGNYAFVAELLYGNSGRLYCVKMCNR